MKPTMPPQAVASNKLNSDAAALNISQEVAHGMNQQAHDANMEMCGRHTAKLPNGMKDKYMDAM